MHVRSASVDFLVPYPDKMSLVQSTILAVSEKLLLSSQMQCGLGPTFLCNQNQTMTLL